MRLLLFGTFVHLFSTGFSQKGNELLVYSLKGNVYVTENNKESKLKIGKVLNPGCTIKTERNAKLTLVCKEGRPISVTREGSFPVALWKDSCATSRSSVSARYFQYIWDQMYARSDDYKRDHPGGSEGMSDAPVRGQDEKEIVINHWLDSLNYATGDFPLSWASTFGYTGKYHFILENAKTNKKIYQDSVDGQTISLSKLKTYMRPGQFYRWSVATKETGVYHGGVIKFVTLKAINQQLLQFQKSVDVPEEPAAQYFRTGYMLQHAHFPVDAALYYKKAMAADPGTSFYTEMWNEFKATFQVR